jgi:hypothetical protein
VTYLFLASPKYTIMTRKVFLAVALLACLGTVITIGLRHANVHRRVADAAVNT